MTQITKNSTQYVLLSEKILADFQLLSQLMIQVSILKCNPNSFGISSGHPLLQDNNGYINIKFHNIT